MYTTKNVLFEQLKTVPKKIYYLFILYLFSPFIFMCGIWIPELHTFLSGVSETLSNLVKIISITCLILWAPVMFIFLFVTIKRGVGISKYYVNCPADCRFEIETTFDFESKPGKVFCIIQNPESGTPYKQIIQYFQYDPATKILLYIFNSDVKLVPGGRRGVQTSARFFTGVVLSPYSEELLDLIHKNNINERFIKKIHPNAAAYIKQAAEQKY